MEIARIVSLAEIYYVDFDVRVTFLCPSLRVCLVIQFLFYFCLRLSVYVHLLLCGGILGKLY